MFYHLGKIEPGDVITALNGVPITQLDHEQVVGVMKQNAGDQIRLTVARQTSSSNVATQRGLLHHLFGSVLFI